jgi:hypothetical protein
VETANKKYPSIARANQETHKLKGEVSVARTQYLPRMDMLFQELRASQNVTAGTILPQYLNVIPIQSGVHRPPIQVSIVSLAPTPASTFPGSS